jgi:hypothetical protein
MVRSGNDRESDGYHYTPGALATFPRYNVLNALRVEVERLDPAKLGDLENARQLLVAAGETAQDDFTRPPTGVIEQRAMAEERSAFLSHIRGLTLADLSAVEALPYRRVLATEESKSIWARLRNRWQIPEHHWYPLTNCGLPDVVAFKATAFDKGVPYKSLRTVLAARGIDRLWELREYGPEYEQDISLFEPFYNGAEGYWSSGGFDWIFYASHENSVTAAGWLLQKLKDLWPAWQSHVWTSPFD